MGKTFWILVMVALVLVYVSGAVVWLYIRRKRKLKRIARQEELQEIEDARKLLEELPEELQFEYETIKDLLKGKYDSVRKNLKIPPDPALTVRRIDVFCLSNCDILNYCWDDGPNIYFFPQWESIEAGLDAGGINNYCPGDENMLLTPKVSKNSIGYWRTLPDGMVKLAYAPKSGETADLLLDTAVEPVFNRFMPEKELDYLIKNVYPKSPQNIFDISKEFSRLNRSWKNGGITDKEYDNKKKRILITM